MKKKLIIFIFSIFSMHIGYSQTNALNNGRVFISLLFAKEYSLAIDYFDESVIYKINDETLKNISSKMEGSLGKYKKLISIKEDSTSTKKVFLYYCEFENTNIDIKIIFENNSKILGFFLNPHKDEKEKKNEG